MGGDPGGLLRERVSALGGRGSKLCLGKQSAPIPPVRHSWLGLYLTSLAGWRDDVLALLEALHRIRQCRQATASPRALLCAPLPMMGGSQGLATGTCVGKSAPAPLALGRGRRGCSPGRLAR